MVIEPSAHWKYLYIIRLENYPSQNQPTIFFEEAKFEGEAPGTMGKVAFQGMEKYLSPGSSTQPTERPIQSR